MIVEPLTRSPRRRWALVTPGWHALLVESAEAGEEDAHGPFEVAALLARHATRVLYCRGALGAFRDTTDPTHWEGETWRGRVVRMRHLPTGASIVTLRDALESSTDPFGDLAHFIEYVRARGVSPAGLGSMGFSLWRSTLTRAVRLDSDPEVSRAALYGSRQAAPDPRRFKLMRAVDIRRAYTHAMGTRPYGTHLREVDRTTGLDPTTSGIAEATVYVDGGVDIPPLPVRVADDAIQFQRGIIRGSWAFCELAAAKELGFGVRVARAWAPTEVVDLFGVAFQAMVDEVTSLDGAAARLGKAATNATWGSFGMRGDARGVVTWAHRDHPAHVVTEPRPLPHVRAAHIAAETAARLRARVLLEALYGRGVAAAVHVDTDGIILRGSSPLPEPSGTAPGEWREKGYYSIVDVKAPQVWRGLAPDAERWQYCVAGVGAARAAEVFRSMPAGIRCGVRGLDVVLPPGQAGDVGSLVIEANRAKAAQLAMYGPSLLD